MKYNLTQLLQQFDKDEKLKYIFFWRHSAKNATITKTCFSQWYPLGFTVEGITYQTAEHWMMAKKAALFHDEEILQKIIQSNSPGEAQALGRKVRHFNRTLWDEHKSNIVMMGNYHKFSQNPALHTFLKQTKKRILVEASPVDKIWGIGLVEDHPDVTNPHLWQGENLLGFAIMEARDRLFPS